MWLYGISYVASEILDKWYGMLLEPVNGVRTVLYIKEEFKWNMYTKKIQAIIRTDNWTDLSFFINKAQPNQMSLINWNCQHQPIIQ